MALTRITSGGIEDGTVSNDDLAGSIADSKLNTISTAGKVSNSATTATDANTASAIVARDASGNFSAGTITADLDGNASTVTTNANLTGDVTSVGNATSIAAGAIVDGNVNASAAIAGTKISPDFGAQNLTVDTNTFFVDAENNRVGIGTASPLYNLHISAATTPRLLIGSTGTAAGDSAILQLSIGGTNAESLIYFGDSGDSNAGQIRYDHATDYMAFQTNANERLRLTSTGELKFVGAGTVGTNEAVYFSGSAPANSLVVNASGNIGVGAASIARAFEVNSSLQIVSAFKSSSTIASRISFSDDNTTDDSRSGIGSVGDGTAIYAGSLERLTILSDGKVGIGTTDPAHQLVVGQNAWIGTGGGESTGSGTPRTLTIAANRTATDVSPSLQLLKGYTGATTTAGGFKLELANATTGAPELAFYSGTSTGNSASSFVEPSWSEERLRIDSDGRLLVGTNTTSAANTLVLQGSNGGAVTQAIATLANTSSSLGDDAILGSIRFSDSSHDPAANIEVRRDGGTWTSTSSQPTRLQFYTTADGLSDPTPRMTIKSDGKVGIGTTDPLQLLHVSTGNNTDSGEVSIALGGSTASARSALITKDTSTPFNFKIVASQSASVASALVFETKTSTEVARIDSSGRLLVGTDTELSVITRSIDLAGTGLSTEQPAINIAHFAGAASTTTRPILNFYRTRGTQATPTANSINDLLGQINFNAYDGNSTDYYAAGSIECFADAAHGVTDTPGRLVFSTTPTGSSTPVDRMNITNLGSVQPLYGIGGGGVDHVLFGPVTSISIDNGGSGYTDGTYQSVVLRTNGGLRGVAADFTVSGGVITQCTVAREGRPDLNAVGDELTLDDTSALGPGTGLSLSIGEIRSAQISYYANPPRIRLSNSDGSTVNQQELGSILFSTRDATSGYSGAGDVARIVVKALGTSGGAYFQFWTATNGTQSAENVSFAGGPTYTTPYILIHNNIESNELATCRLRALQYGRNGGEIIFGRENADSWSPSLNADGYIAFAPARDSTNTERMRIKSDGSVNVGMGAGTFPGTDGVEFLPSGQINASRTSGIALRLNRGSTNGDIVEFYRSSTSVGSISVTATDTSYNTSSDYRLKENIVPLTGAADRLKQLKPSQFNFIADPGKTVDGFIAHEAQEVVPESVTGTKDEVEAVGTLTRWDGKVLQTDVPEPESLTFEEEVIITPAVEAVPAEYDDDGNELTPAVDEVPAVTENVTRTNTWTKTGERPVYQGIDQSKLVPLLTAALQEALAKIETLEQRLNDAGIA